MTEEERIKIALRMAELFEKSDAAYHLFERLDQGYMDDHAEEVQELLQLAEAFKSSSE